MKNYLVALTLFLANVFCSFAQKATIHFDVVYNEKTIGSLVAFKEVKGNRVFKDLKTNTDAKVLMISVHVESEVTVNTEREVLLTGKGYRHANRGAEDMSTFVLRTTDKKYKIVKNGDERLINVPEIKFCVIDLYFTEPKGITKVFSNTVGDFLKLAALPNNTYELTQQNGKINTFHYTNGMLTKVEAETTVGKVIFKRKK